MKVDGITSHGLVIIKSMLKPMGIGVLIGSIVFVLLIGLNSGGPGRQSFSIFGLLFGIGVVGWSVAITSTHSIQTFARVSKKQIEWSEEDVRRAMAVLCVFSIGGMIGVFVLSSLYHL
jgi:hypothetical protein